MRAWGRGLGVLLLLLLFSAPLVAMVLGSLGQPGLPPPDGNLDLVPDSARWANYGDASTITPLARQIANTALVVVVAVPVSVLVASLAGFVITVGSTRQRHLLVVGRAAADPDDGVCRCCVELRGPLGQRRRADPVADQGREPDSGVGDSHPRVS